MNMKTHIFLFLCVMPSFYIPYCKTHGAMNRLFIRFIPIVAVYWGKR